MKPTARRNRSPSRTRPCLTGSSSRSHRLEIVDVELVYFEGCPHAETAYERILEVVSGRSDVRVTKHLVVTQEDAKRRHLHGSPTILVDGIDPFADPDAPIAWACRIYETSSGHDGSPTVAMLDQALSPSVPPIQGRPVPRGLP